jgi:hypothetical protein
MIRLLRGIGWLGVGWACFVLLTQVPALGIIGLVCLAIKGAKRLPELWHHGTAKWSTEKDLAQCIRAKSGLLIGRLIR